jgi:hypothetical protein
MRTLRYHLAIMMLFLMVQLAAQAQADAQKGLNNVVVLEGRLMRKLVYGPPGFGETPRVDSKITVYYVALKVPMTPQQLKLSSSLKHPGTRNYEQVQLYCGNTFTTCNEFLRSHMNHSVLVRGTIAYALEPNDVYPVTMTVAAMDTK